MSALITAFEKQIAEIALHHLPLTFILMIVVIALAVIIAIRYNHKMNQDEADREMRRLIIKQQGKIIRLLGAVPCISKRNATWLADPKLNDQAPDQPMCKYCSAIKKGES